MKKETLKNAIIGFCGQFIILLLGLLVPRIIILNYGSDTNGVFSTITQIFTYMALLEAGIGQAAKNLLYKPFKNKNKDEISKIYCISQKYYQKITLFYFLGVVISSLVVPLVIKSDLDFFSIALICFFQGAGGALSFYYIQTQSVILNVDGRSYINNISMSLNQFWNDRPAHKKCSFNVYVEYFIKGRFFNVSDGAFYVLTSTIYENINLIKNFNSFIDDFVTIFNFRNIGRYIMNVFRI